ncbi:MAG: ribonuclease III [Opitutae bacterium]
MGLFDSIKLAVKPQCPSPKDGEFSVLENQVGYHFKQVSLLREALTHPSFDSRKSRLRNNQRLEFLGDSVVGCILAKWLFHRFPDLPEGDLSRKKSLLARGHNLAVVARKINLQDHLIIGKSERLSKGNLRQSVLEDAFEALIGAIYLDSDYATTERVMLKWESLFLSTLKDKNSDFNPKGKLQEFLQAQPESPKVSYHLIKQSGPDHRKEFKVELRINGTPISTGLGQSKKKAEEEAAQAAIKALPPSSSEKN